MRIDICNMEIREHLKVGNTYHISTRSNGSDVLFRSALDYNYFRRKSIERLSEAWEILAHTFLPSEIHFVIRIVKNEIDGENVNHSTLFSHLLNGYVQHFNHVHQRSGSLLNRSFRRERISDGTELENLICKIHNLPVALNLVKAAREWKYSSYNEFQSTKPKRKTIVQLLAMFGDLDSFLRKHSSESLIVADLTPPKFWKKILSPLEILFRLNNPLGVHRWARRRPKPPP